MWIDMILEVDKIHVSLWSTVTTITPTEVSAVSTVARQWLYVLISLYLLPDTVHFSLNNCMHRAS